MNHTLKYQRIYIMWNKRKVMNSFFFLLCKHHKVRRNDMLTNKEKYIQYKLQNRSRQHQLLLLKQKDINQKLYVFGQLLECFFVPDFRC